MIRTLKATRSAVFGAILVAVAAIAVSGCQNKSGSSKPGQGTAASIPANYFAAMSPDERLHRSSRHYVYCIDDTTMDPVSGQHIAVEHAVNTWIAALNAAIKAAPASANAGDLFSAEEIPCAVPGDAPIPGVAKWIVHPIDGGNTGYTRPITDPASPAVITASVTEMAPHIFVPSSVTGPLGAFGAMYDDAEYLRIAGHEMGRSLGIFGGADIPKTTSGQQNIMYRVAPTAQPSTGDVVTVLLLYQGVPAK